MKQSSYSIYRADGLDYKHMYYKDSSTGILHSSTGIL